MESPSTPFSIVIPNVLFAVTMESRYLGFSYIFGSMRWTSETDGIVCHLLVKIMSAICDFVSQIWLVSLNLLK